MIMKLIHNELRKTKVSRYQISKETGVPESILSKVFNNEAKDLNTKNAVKLLKYFGYKIVKEGGK
jgi:predicted XRE-type DNA-binding protein